MIDLKAIRQAAEAANKLEELSLDQLVEYLNVVPTEAVIALLDRLEAAERVRDEFLTALAECRDAMPTPAVNTPGDDLMLQAIADPLAVPAYVRESVSMLVPKQLLEAAEKDAMRMNWLEQNLFNRENIDWITKKPCTKFNMWVMFSPKSVQGSARGIIDAAMGEQT